MTCIKTGARVYFENYSFMVSADLYQVGDAIIIRWMPRSQNYIAEEHMKMEGATHTVAYIINSDIWWHRDDIGVTVIPASMLETVA